MPAKCSRFTFEPQFSYVVTLDYTAIYYISYTHFCFFIYLIFFFGKKEGGGGFFSFRLSLTGWDLPIRTKPRKRTHISIHTTVHLALIWCVMRNRVRSPGSGFREDTEITFFYHFFFFEKSKWWKESNIAKGLRGGVSHVQENELQFNQ